VKSVKSSYRCTWPADFFLCGICLPDSVVSAESVNSFKSRLDNFWSMYDFVYMIIEPVHLLPEVKC